MGSCRRADRPRLRIPGRNFEAVSQPEGAQHLQRFDERDVRVVVGNPPARWRAAMPSILRAIKGDREGCTGHWVVW